MVHLPTSGISSACKCDLHKMRSHLSSSISPGERQTLTMRLVLMATCCLQMQYLTLFTTLSTFPQSPEISIFANRSGVRSIHSQKLLNVNEPERLRSHDSGSMHGFGVRVDSTDSDTVTAPDQMNFVCVPNKPMIGHVQPPAVLRRHLTVTTLERDMERDMVQAFSLNLHQYIRPPRRALREHAQVEKISNHLKPASSNFLPLFCLLSALPYRDKFMA